uniref:Uncharacterized protein n=1 Tax=Tanacetum cinerariifolium TaxID=118510 RepID=A0A699TB72_TANCI|nr:hypothetical protein [Tanacetum cinerariifolium]
MDERSSLMVEKMQGLIKSWLNALITRKWVIYQGNVKLKVEKIATTIRNTNPKKQEKTDLIQKLWLLLMVVSIGISKLDVIPTSVSVSAGDVAAAVVGPHSETEFALIGLSTEVSIPVTYPLCYDSKYKLIKKDYQGQREQLNDCVVDLKAHKHAVKSLEKQIKCDQTNQLAYEDKIRVLSYELEEKSNILEYRQKLIDQATH